MGNKESFIQYMQSIKNDFDSQNYKRYIDKKLDTELEEIVLKISNKNLYDINDISELDELSKILNNENPQWHDYSYKKNSHGIPNAIIFTHYKNFLKEKNDSNIMEQELGKLALNLILYGPPGTGKTYKANQIINVFKEYNEGIFKKNKKISKDLSDLTWSEAIALGMSTDNQEHTPNEIYELKYTKEFLDNKKQSGRKTPECSLRSDLMRNTIKNEQLAESGKTGNDYFVYNNGKYKLSNNGKLLAQELLKAENEKFNVSDFCKFVTFHQSYSYEDFVIGIKPKEEENSLLFQKQRGIFKKLCDDALNNPDYKYLLNVSKTDKLKTTRMCNIIIHIY